MMRPASAVSSIDALGVFPDARDVRVIRHNAPEITRPTDVLLRVLDVGVCGTDREIAAFDYGEPPKDSDYLILGHEALAEVVKVGSSVSHLRVGDLVVPTVRRPCTEARCVACRADRPDFCYTGNFTERGIKHAHGFMTEVMVEEERNLVPVPPDLRDVGVLTEPLAVAEKALMQLWQVQERLPWACPLEPGRQNEQPGWCRRAVVLGAGPVGLLGAMLLTANGFRVTVYSREPSGNRSASVAHAVGAEYVSSSTDSVERLAERIGNIDLVYEATGASRIAFELMKVLGVNGVFIFTGVPGRSRTIELEADRIMRALVLKNQVVFGTINAGRNAYEAAVKDLADMRRRWPEAVRGLITGRYPLRMVPELLRSKGDGIKQVIAPHGPGSGS